MTEGSRWGWREVVLGWGVKWLGCWGGEIPAAERGYDGAFLRGYDGVVARGWREVVLRWS